MNPFDMSYKNLFLSAEMGDAALDQQMADHVLHRDRDGHLSSRHSRHRGKPRSSQV